jgi:hypothetical protein
MSRNSIGIVGAALVAAGIVLGVGSGIAAEAMNPLPSQAPLTVRDGRDGPPGGPFSGMPAHHQPGQRR